MQLFDSGGAKKGTEVPVNDTTSELGPSSTQDSPAIAFEGQDVVVAWVRPPLRNPPGQSGNCSLQPYVPTNVYARRYRLDTSTQTLAAVGGPMIVNSDSGYIPYGNVDTRPRPAVAISKDGSGRFIVAWSAKNQTPASLQPQTVYQRVRGQFFQGARPLGREFTINQDDSAGPGAPMEPTQRRLANSAEHTIAYGADGRVVCVWETSVTEESVPPGPPPPPAPENDFERVFFTILPPSYADYRVTHDIGTGCKGDMDYSGGVDGLDIQGFTDVFVGLNGHRCHSYVDNFYRADINNDGVINFYDVDCFINLLFNYTGQCVSAPSCSPTPGVPYDCNGNGVADATDITNGTSHDCNHNGHPDSCDLALGPGWGFSDCNGNGVPDDCDVAAGTVPDCNHNGVPDSCDIASGTSHDGDHNGIPDECQTGGDGPTGGGGENICADAPSDLNAAWAELRNWAAHQTWGPASGLTGAQQYQRYVNKLCALGLIVITQ